MRNRVSRVAIGALLALAGCDWFTTFSEQPKIDPWEQPGLSGMTAADREKLPFRANPQMSVPTTGTAVAGFQVSYSPLPNVVDSMSGLANPTAPSDSSLASGRRYYQLNCTVCHGDSGAGDGTATKYGMVPISLLTPSATGRSDGYIWGMMRNGRGLMPSYNRIEEMDRWDVVNYVRALQGRLGAAATTGPLAAPGVTGSAVPGYTTLGPTRPGVGLGSGNASLGARRVNTAPADTTARRDTAATRGPTP